MTPALRQRIAGILTSVAGSRTVILTRVRISATGTMLNPAHTSLVTGLLPFIAAVDRFYRRCLNILLAFIAGACAIFRSRIAERQLRFHTTKARMLARKRNNSMKTSNAGRLIFWLATIFAIGILVRAESSEKRANTASSKRAPFLIVDQKGRPAVNGLPSPNGQTFDVTVGPDFAFHPDTVNISVGDTVRWTWSGSGHSVTSGPPCAADSQFCSPNDTMCFPGVLSNAGTVYQHTFANAGSYSYHCLAHCLAGMTGTVNVAGGCTPAGWSAGANLPGAGVRLAGVYFPANGKFYAMGGRDASDVEFTHPFEYDPASNTWTTKAATYPDADTNNMACSILADSGTPYIYCVGGSNFATQAVTGRVFRYDPTADVITSVSSNWPSGDAGILPGGFSVFNNTLVILGGFDVTNGVGNDQIWQFTPNPAGWVQKSSHLPVPLGYLPTTTIDSLIYTGGGADITGGTLTDTTNSFVYNPVADSISTVASIPRATSNTRAVNFNGQMWVLGGQFPTPSNEVDIYDPVANSWSLGPPMLTARRNAAMDSDGTTRIWAAGGYDDTGVANTTTDLFCNAGGGTPTPTPTATATATATPSATATATAGGSPTATPTATASGTAMPTPTPPGTRTTPTPRPRPTPAPRP